ENRADRCAAAHFRGAAVGWRFAVAVDRLGADRNARTISEHEGVEANPEPRAILELAAALHLGHRAEHLGARWNRDAIADPDVAAHVCFDPILDSRCLTGDLAFGLQADHGVSRDDQLFERLLRRLGRLWRFWSDRLRWTHGVSGRNG